MLDRRRGTPSKEGPIEETATMEEHPEEFRCNTTGVPEAPELAVLRCNRVSDHGAPLDDRLDAFVGGAGGCLGRLG
jgi:hypothetical protein